MINDERSILAGGVADYGIVVGDESSREKRSLSLCIYVCRLVWYVSSVWSIFQPGQ